MIQQRPPGNALETTSTGRRLAVFSAITAAGGDSDEDGDADSDGTDESMLMLSEKEKEQENWSQLSASGKSLANFF